ncbi:MAG: biliverdin-producing heme oxygenase [Actinobacteria bacterium]|nr:biliverdin-producing heme oxygenase [Actinomycetota bacterium]
MTFDAAVVAAVTAHMNDDHTDDNLLIARAFGRPEATAARMTGVDADGGTWSVTDPAGVHELIVPWPQGPLSDRPQIRKAVVLLYRTACERLGVAARAEHDAAAAAASPQGAGAPHGHPGNGHPGHGPHGHGSSVAGEAEPGFARRLREATWTDHGDSEGATFMTDIMRGRGTLTDYTDLVAQHWFMYEALEEAAAPLAADPALAALHPEGIRRMAAIERDLAHLLGAQWRTRIAALPATAAYAARIRQVAAEGWTAGIVAHHYTRYLGDLSGGQLIARRAAAQFGFDGDGVAFYDFAELGDPAAFKTGYRAVLDDFGVTLDDAEQGRMLDEVRTAYRFNTEVFVDLGEARAAA